MQLQRFLKKSSGQLDTCEDAYSKIYPTCSQPTRIYGIPKIHRPSALDSMAPFRPIVSSIGTYNYEFDK